jgi:hypothetical protein
MLRIAVLRSNSHCNSSEKEQAPKRESEKEVVMMVVRGGICLDHLSASRLRHHFFMI